MSSDLDLDFDLVAPESRHARHDSLWARLLRRINPLRRTTLPEGFTVKAKFRPEDSSFQYLGRCMRLPAPPKRSLSRCGGSGAKHPPHGENSPWST